nr:hypothetical protein [Coprococcus sp. AF21-14LB]
MKHMVEQRMPIKKRSISTDNAVDLFEKYGMTDKAKLFEYRRSSSVNIYRMNEFEDYYYGYMVPDAGYLKYFKLYLLEEGFVLQMPEASSPKKVPDFEPQMKLFQVLKESTRWGDMQNIENVGDLNERITKGDEHEAILVQERCRKRK